MGRVTYAFPVEKLQGKANKQDSVYFCTRLGRTYVRRIVNPYTGDITAQQQKVRDDFKDTVSRVHAIMADKSSTTYQTYEESWKSNPEGCYTLYGYIFMKEYKH